MDRLVIDSAAGVGQLSVEYLAPDQGYRVALGAPGIAVTAETDLSWDRLHSFLDGLAKDWRGWGGVRELSALPPNVPYSAPAFKVSATTDGSGHFTLVAELGQPFIGSEADQEDHKTHVGMPDSFEPGAWRARVVIVLETWQLDGLVQDLVSLSRSKPRGFY